MAVTKTVQLWDYDARAFVDPHWEIHDCTITTDYCDWLVLCGYKAGGYTDVDINGTLKDSYKLWLVGNKATVSGTPLTTITLTHVAGYTSVSPTNTFSSSLTVRGNYNMFQGAVPSSPRGNWSDLDYEFADAEAFYAALDNGEIQPTLPKVYFDVYINGSNKPSIFVNWTASESLSPTLLRPKLWIGCDDILMPHNDDLTDIGNPPIRVPNTSRWNVDSAGSFSYAGSYSTTYLSIQQNFEQYLNPVSKVERWGFNGEPEFVNLYLRMDMDATTGTDMFELYRVGINMNGTLKENYKVPNSASNPNVDTYVRIHFEEPDYVLPEDDPNYPGGKDINDDGPGRYDPDNPPPVEDFEDHKGNGFDGNAVLTKTYAVTAATLQNIGQKLWTQSYFDVLKVQSNPIENIVSVKGLPMAFTGTAEEIKVGDVAFGINGDKVASAQKITIGTIKYMGKYGNYLDFAPYTKTKLNLPYIGLIELDPADLYNSTLKIEYIIDLVTGQCMAILTLDGIPFMNVTGQMGFDIPITASDRVQTELRVASAAITAVGGAAGHMIAGDILGAGIGGASSALSLMGADYTSQRTASPSPACASFANHLVYLLVDRPLYEGESKGYKHLHGYPCHKYMNLGSLSGFVAVDARTDINIAMTSEENAMLEQLLTQGIYI